MQEPMQLPKFHETFNPILEVLASGDAISSIELQKKVRDIYYFELSEDLLSQKTSTGANTLLDRINWGKSYLRQAKLVDYPKRALVQITEKGRNIINKGGTTYQELKKDEDFLNYRKESQLKSDNKKWSYIEEILIENSSPQDLIDSWFTAIETQIKTDLLERLREVDPYYFEKVILILLKKMWYGDFIETSKSWDGWIDGIINEDKLGLEKIYIQAKRYNENKVREKEIRNFIGAMSRDTTKGIFATTSSFDEHAIKKAYDAQHKIILIDGKKLVDLMHQYWVGVQVKNTYEVKEIDEDFFEDN